MNYHKGMSTGLAKLIADSGKAAYALVMGRGSVVEVARLNSMSRSDTAPTEALRWSD